MLIDNAINLSVPVCVFVSGQGRCPYTLSLNDQSTNDVNFSSIPCRLSELQLIKLSSFMSANHLYIMV